MQIYIVGGAVRDELLGLPVKDRDYVVVGASPQDMLALGYRPVGKDFPVFLHPRTQEEYALARTERKTAPGYAGFAFHAAADVTLEQDLARRDLTINAIARADDGVLTDPFRGQEDLRARVFRHVSPAFAEDPVRILRVARLAARFPDFVVAPETAALMCAMVAAGEADALVPERVWQELARGLCEQRPSRLFEVLRDCGALARVAPELDALWASDAGGASLRAIDHCARLGDELAVRFAVLTLAMPDGAALQSLCKRLKVPNDCRDLALMAWRERAAVERALQAAPDALVALLGRCDALRKPRRFADMLRAIARVQFQAQVPAPDSEQDFAPAVRLQEALRAAQQVDAGAIAATLQGQPQGIAAAVLAARVAAVSALSGTGGAG